MTRWLHSHWPVNGVEYHAVECGPDRQAGDLVLLLHGFPESWYSWRHQLPALAAAGFRAVALDMLGYGRSASPQDTTRYDQIALSDDIAELARTLGHERFHVVGHDWGAPTAWYTAMRYARRVKTVTALSVPYGGQPPQPPTQGFAKLFADCFFYMQYFQEEGVAEAELEADLPRFLRSFLFSCCGENPGGFDTRAHPPSARLLDVMADPGYVPGWLSEGDFAFYLAEFARGGLRGPLSYYRNLDRTWSRSRELHSALIEQPALFIAGEHDPVPRFGGELKRMARWVPQVESHTVTACGHWTQQEQPDEVNRLLVSFLDVHRAP